MPGFDSTGPEGKGSMTGRGLGKCNSNNKKSEEETALKDFPRRKRRLFGSGEGKGLGQRRGRGRGRGLGRSRLSE